MIWDAIGLIVTSSWWLMKCEIERNTTVLIHEKTFANADSKIQASDGINSNKHAIMGRYQLGIKTILSVSFWVSYNPRYYNSFILRISSCIDSRGYDCWNIPNNYKHYCDVMMASQITSLTIVYSIVHSGADQRKHQSSAWLAFVRENSPVSGEFPAQRARNAENVSIWWRHH